MQEIVGNMTLKGCSENASNIFTTSSLTKKEPRQCLLAFFYNYSHGSKWLDFDITMGLKFEWALW